jgi:hypothetical protein
MSGAMMAIEVSKQQDGNDTDHKAGCGDAENAPAESKGDGSGGRSGVDEIDDSDGSWAAVAHKKNNKL